MAYIVDIDFSSDTGFTHASPNSTISVAGGFYNLVVNSYVDFGNGSYHTAGWTYVADSIVFIKLKLSNTTNGQTALKWGQRRNSTAITDEGYDLYLAAGMVGGTSWSASTGFADRAMVATTDYWLKYKFKSGGDLQTWLNGGAFAGWTGIRDMVGAGITNGTIRFHWNAAGISPNDGSGAGMQIDRFIVANAADADPSFVVNAGGDEAPEFDTESLQLIGGITGGSGSYTYLWTVDDPALTFNDATIAQPTATFGVNPLGTERVFTLTLTGGDGISSGVQDQMTITQDANPDPGGVPQRNLALQCVGMGLF